MVSLGCDELLDVRVVHPQDTHLGAPAMPCGRDGLTDGIEDTHETDGA